MNHRTYMETEKVELQKAPITFHVHNGSGRIGKMLIRQGSVSWYPKNARRPHTIGWEDLSELLEVFGRQRKQPKQRGI